MLRVATILRVTRSERLIPSFRSETISASLEETGPGPVNFIDVHPRVQTQLPHGVSISTDLIVQWRENVKDGVYALPGFLLVPSDGSRARFVGYRPGAEVRWQINRHAYLQADWNFLCREISERSITRTQPELHRVLGGLQILRGNPFRKARY